MQKVTHGDINPMEQEFSLVFLFAGSHILGWPEGDCTRSFIFDGSQHLLCQDEFLGSM